MEPPAAPPIATKQAALPTTRARLAVLGLQSEVVSAQDLRVIEDALSAAAQRYAQLDVIAASDMRAMVELGASQQMMGCDNAACMTAFGSMLACSSCSRATYNPSTIACR